jgi:hypothetical protein
MRLSPEIVFILILAFLMIEGLVALLAIINERRKGGSHDA